MTRRKSKGAVTGLKSTQQPGNTQDASFATDDEDDQAKCSLSEETIVVIDRISAMFAKNFNACVDRIVDSIERKT